MNKETADFVKHLSDAGNRVGTYARDVARGWLPNGVDPDDPAVQKIVQQCRDYCVQKEGKW